MRIAIFTIAFALSAVALESPAVTRNECQHQFNKCKNDIKNVFNQNKCKKARNTCEAQAAHDEQAAAIKNKMMSGQLGTTDMKSQMMNGTAGDHSMKNKMMAGTTEPALDPKEAARRRLLEREKAKNDLSR